jgi:addiction module RelE/StbE family toxin
MKIFFSDNFEKKLKKLIKKDSQLKIEFKKQIKLFVKNPHHPSLKTHKLQGKRSSQMAIWIKPNLRALYIVQNQDIIFVNIVSHDEY